MIQTLINFAALMMAAMVKTRVKAMTIAMGMLLLQAASGQRRQLMISSRKKMAMARAMAVM